MSTLSMPVDSFCGEPEGVSRDFFAVMRSKVESYAAFAANAITQITAEQQFGELAATWREETAFASSVEDIVMHPAHQRILTMGAQVVPWILRELKDAPGHWFYALNLLTGEDPIPQEIRGDVRRMTRAWLDWAKMKGYTV